MATTNNTTTWKLSLDGFEADKPQWNRTIVALASSVFYTKGIFISNLPLYMQKTFVKADGTLDDDKLRTFFENKANEIIDKIVRNRKVLDVVLFTDLPIYTQTKLQNTVYEGIEFLLSGSYNNQQVSNSIQIEGLSIDSTITDTTTISQLLGSKGYTTLIRSGIQEYEWDATKGVLIFKGLPYYAHFKSGEILGETEIDGGSESLITKKNVVALLGQAISENKIAILNTTEILDIIRDYDTYIKANLPVGTVATLGSTVDIEYVGTETIFLNPNIVETYVFDGTNWLIISSNYLLREAIDNLSAQIENLREELNLSVASETTLDDTELVAWEGTNY